MILLNVVWLVVAASVFLLLRRRPLITRIMISGAVFVILSAGSMYVIFKAAGEPLDGYVPVSEEVLKQEGMTQEQWEEYKNSLAQEEADSEEEQ